MYVYYVKCFINSQDSQEFSLFKHGKKKTAEMNIFNADKEIQAQVLFI